MTKRLVPLLLCLVLFLSLMACQNGKTSSFHDGPVPGFTWGMTWEEVVDKITDAGLFEKDVTLETSSETYKLMQLTSAQAKELGIDNVFNMPLSDKSVGIELQFDLDRSSTPRLTYARFRVATSDENVLKKNMEAASVASINSNENLEDIIWLSASDKEKISQNEINNLNETQKAAYEAAVQANEQSLLYPYAYITKGNGTTIWLTANFYVYLTYGNY